jgi:hypothetical protein
MSYLTAIYALSSLVLSVSWPLSTFLAFSAVCLRSSFSLSATLAIEAAGLYYSPLLNHLALLYYYVLIFIYPFNTCKLTRSSPPLKPHFVGVPRKIRFDRRGTASTLRLGWWIRKNYSTNTSGALYYSKKNI